MKRWIKYSISLLLYLSLCISWFNASAQSPVVHAVLFYSPSCGHCHKVMTEDLPPLMEKYQDQLKILAIDVSVEGGQALYQSAIEHFQIPGERLGVPTLVVGSTVLVGSAEIPGQFPGLVEQGLSSGGLDWPAIPGLVEVVQDVQVAPEEPAAENPPPGNPQVENEPEPADVQPESEQPVAEQPPVSQSPAVRPLDESPSPAAKSLAWSEKFAQDRAGNTLAVIVLIGMAASVVGVFFNFSQKSGARDSRLPVWMIPLLVLVGTGIAAYLSMVELTHAEAVCGPVGDCNTVQQSPYAYLFGILPIGVLGVAGYLAIFAAWAAQTLRPDTWGRPGALLVWGMALFGVLFSIYLTFLEPFVIGATCAWCVSSAVVMTLILWAATPAAKRAWYGQRLSQQRSGARP